jgi:hypothetical protein
MCEPSNVDNSDNCLKDFYKSYINKEITILLLLLTIAVPITIKARGDDLARETRSPSMPILSDSCFICVLCRLLLILMNY